MTITDASSALHDLGVRDGLITPDEKAFLDREGHLIMPDMLSMQQVELLRRRFDELLAAEGPAAGREVDYTGEPGFLADLVNKGAEFDIFYEHPRVLAAMVHVLGLQIRLSSLNGRTAPPGMGLQKLHADWHTPVAPDQFQVCNSIWLLDPFTADNGATRVVPGSHKSGKLPADAMADCEAPHPDEIKLVAPAGTVVIFNSHAWHGGTLNRTNLPRRAIHSYFTRRHNRQQLDQRKFIQPATLARLSPAARWVLDVA